MVINSLGMKGIISVYNPQVNSIAEGSLDRNSNRAWIWGQEFIRGHKGVLFPGYFPMACSARLLNYYFYFLLKIIF